MKSYRFGFIGTGNIASAILNGQMKSGNITPENIFLYDTDYKKCEKFAALGIHICDSSAALVSECDFIFLTVKPQIYPVVLNEIKNSVTADKCLIDVGAGITIDFVKKCIGQDCAVIRVMPNTPLLLCQGATALAKENPVTDEQFDTIRMIFGSCGVTEVVDESMINTVTAVSGSSPAFVFRFAKALISTGAELGLSAETAKNLAVQTIIGSAEMIRSGDMDIDSLIAMVASPNGTTVAGLNALDRTGFDESVRAAVIAAENRADELAKGE